MIIINSLKLIYKLKGIKLKSFTTITTLFFIALFPIFGGCQNKEQGTQDLNKIRNDSLQVQNDSVKVRRGVERDLTNEGEVRRIYYDRGTTKTETQYKGSMRNGFHRAYDEDGKLTAEVTFVNDKMEGEFKAYYPDGSMKLLAHYHNGILDGASYTYFPDGRIELEERYTKNKLTYAKKYNPDGTVEYEDKY